FSQGENLAGRTIQGVEFVGLRNVTADELYPLIYSRIGEPLQPENFNNDLKALFGTGYFGNVEMRLRPNANETVDVIFIVEELPRISDIEFLGADELPLQEVKSVLGFVQGDVYSPQKVKEGVALIKARYREDGFFFAEVWYRTGELDPETNQLQITYIIDEGDDIPISRINILGTRHLDAEDILDILEQKEVGFFDEGKFQESLFEEDKLKILAYAKSSGYVDAEIDPRATGYEIRWRNPEKPEDGRVVIITYKLVEGDIRFFGGYSVEHNPNAMNLELNPPEREIDGPEDLSPIYKPETLLGSLEFIDADIGEVFDERRYFQDRGFMQEMYSREGYVYAQIRPEFVNFELTEESLNRFESCLAMESPAGEDDSRCKKHAEYLNLTALREYLEDNPEAEGNVLRHIHFTVSENNLAYIENIILKGMEKTQEYVIRRELLIKEGQLFNSALVNRSREKLINLGYFKEVNLQMRPGSS
ncbi:MAG: outer membrane protein assembly factor, partial [Leptospiraceae bacterium]|nr:outer membrane protein assembly factor [Leptospiraceae bacterium]